MPYDGRESRFEAAMQIDEVIAVLADANRWCKGALRRPDGRRCILGALVDVGAVAQLVGPIKDAIVQVSGKPYWRIEIFNDDPATTHAAVLEVLYRTRENLIRDAIAPAPSRQQRHGTRQWAVALLRQATGLFRRPRAAIGDGTPSPAPVDQAPSFAALRAKVDA